MDYPILQKHVDHDPDMGWLVEVLIAYPDEPEWENATGHFPSEWHNDDGGFETRAEAREFCATIPLTKRSDR